MDKPTSNKVAQFYSAKIQKSGALLLRRLVQFYSGVDTHARQFKRMRKALRRLKGWGQP